MPRWMKKRVGHFTELTGHLVLGVDTVVAPDGQGPVRLSKTLSTYITGAPMRRCAARAGHLSAPSLQPTGPVRCASLRGQWHGEPRSDTRKAFMKARSGQTSISPTITSVGLTKRSAARALCRIEKHSRAADQLRHLRNLVEPGSISSAIESSPMPNARASRRIAALMRRFPNTRTARIRTRTGNPQPRERERRRPRCPGRPCGL